MPATSTRSQESQVAHGSITKGTELMLQLLASWIGPFGLFKLPVFEMKVATVLGGRLPNNATWASATQARQVLTFSSIQLAHSVIRADFLEYRHPLLPGIGFLLQASSVIDWRNRTLILRPNGRNLLNDFSRTSLAGR